MRQQSSWGTEAAGWLLEEKWDLPADRAGKRHPQKDLNQPCVAGAVGQAEEQREATSGGRACTGAAPTRSAFRERHGTKMDWPGKGGSKSGARHRCSSHSDWPETLEGRSSTGRAGEDRPKEHPRAHWQDWVMAECRN